jgi:hypothetical protein
VLYFSRLLLDRVVRDYLRRFYWNCTAAGEDDDAFEQEDELAADPGEDVQLARLDLPAFRETLRDSPRRLFDWIVKHGEQYPRHGWQTLARQELGVSDSWVSVNHNKLLVQGRRYFDVAHK